MFGFLIRSEVNDDAVRLKTVADITAKKYCSISFENASTKIRSDFENPRCYIDRHYCSFEYLDLEPFQFVLDRNIDRIPLPLTIFGRSKYLGFMLQTANGGGSWHASVENGVGYTATGGAKKLLDTMERKMNVRNLNKLFDRFK